MWFRKKVKRIEQEKALLQSQIDEYHKISYNNWKGNKYAERLISEWLTHGKICLGVDFDDTFYPWGFKGFEANVMFKRAMDIVKLAQSIGCYTTVWSACAPDRYDYIESYYTANGLKLDSINENAIPLPYGNHKKIYYNWLLDDRAGLEQALDILEYACYRVMTDRKTKAVNFDV